MKTLIKNIIFSFLLISSSALAEDIKLTITELTKAGKHLEAVTLVKEKIERRTLADVLSAAKSAWALGMVSTARDLWDEALANKEFQGIERIRTYLARSILELQEDKYELARQFAERGIADSQPSELRAQLLLVAAESLKSQGASALAEKYYRQAIEEGNEKTKNEALYLLGESQLKSGLTNDARFTLVGIETNSHYTPQTLRYLIEIDLAQKNYESVLTWIDEGKENYAADFEDGKTLYSKVTALLGLDRETQARDELSKYRLQHQEHDSWSLIAQAACEAHSVGEIIKQGENKQEVTANKTLKEAKYE